jgi:hypothetical protein
MVVHLGPPRGRMGRRRSCQSVWGHVGVWAYLVRQLANEDDLVDDRTPLDPECDDH